MKHPLNTTNPTSRTALLALASRTRSFFGPAAVAAVMMSSAPGIDLYWDTNGTDAGSGNVGGTWDTGTTANWNATADGTGTPQNWADGDSAIFSAGTDGTTTKTVTLSGTIETPSILLEENGLVNLSGGIIDITGGSIFDTSVLGADGGRSLDWSSNITGIGDLTIAGHGATSDTGSGSNTSFLLSGSNDFAGDVTITSGVVRADSNLGNAANKVILNGGGLVDTNQNINFTRDLQVDSGSTGVYRTYGSVSTGQISGAVLGGGTLKHTDGGTLTLSGDGSAFTGTYDNTRGNTNFTTADWSGTDIVNRDGSKIRFNAAGTTTIQSYSGDRDVEINGALLDIAGGSFDTTTGAGNNNFLISGSGALTSSSGTLTLDFVTLYTTLGNQQINVVVQDFDGSTPLALIKDGTGAITNFNQANTYSGGTTINAGRINAGNASSFGTGTVTITADIGGTEVGGQAFLTASGATYANDFDLSGIGSSEGAGNLGAIRFQNNTVSGDVAVSNDARVVAYASASGTMSGALSGSGDLEINFVANTLANGTINLTGDASAYTGDLVVSRGTLNMSSATSGGGLEVAADGTFTGDTAFGGNLVLDGNFTGNGDFSGDLTVSDTGSYVGEGSFGGNITLGDTTGAAFTADGSTPAAMHADGNMTLNGTTAVTLTSAVAGANLIATYGGALTGNETNLELVGGLTGYRPGAGFDTTGTPGSVILDIPSLALTWTGEDSDFWEADGIDINWQDGVATDQTYFNGDAVVFDETGATFPDVKISGEVTPISIVVDSTTDYSFTGDDLNFIGGFASLLKRGTSTLTVSGANNFAGGTTLSQGSIIFTGSENNGLGTGPIVLGDGDTGAGDVSLLLTNARRINNDITISSEGTGNATLGFSGTGGNYTAFNGGVTLERDLTILGGTTDRLHFAGSITGSGDVTITGGRRVTWGATNTFDGDVTIMGSGTTLQTFLGNNIPDNSRVTVGSEAILQIYGNQTIGGLDGSGFLQQITGGSYTLTIGSGDAGGTFSGTWRDNGNAVNLVKTGAGTQVFSGTSIGTGTLSVNGGVFSLTHSDALNDAGRVNINDGILNLDFSGEEEIATLYLDGVEQVVALGTTFGAPGSGADIIDGDNFSGAGLLRVGPSDPYLVYEAENNIEGAGAETDSDGDGIPNGIEFVIGGVSDPGIGQSDLDKLPTGSFVNADPDADTNFEDYLLFTYRRTEASADLNPYAEYSTTLGSWTEAEGGVDGVVILETDDGFDTDVDQVDVYIPASLAIDGKLFGRLRVDIP